MATTGLTSNMCILSGFNTALAKNATDTSSYPFGIWFANSHTLYVADEGAGDNTFDTTSGTYGAAAASTTAGLQKWVLKTPAGRADLAARLHAPGRPQPRPALRRRGLSDR